MAEFKATLKQLADGIRIPIGLPHIVRVVNGVFRIRLTGMFFDLDKCFLLPSAMPGIRGIKEQYDKHPGGNLLIVGHTDTSDAPEPNLTLSLERSDSVAAFLMDQVDPWEAFFQAAKPQNKRWGMREIQMMLSTVPDPESAFYRGPIDGVEGPITQKAIKDFQSANGLKVDGIAGPDTRKSLIKAYMAQDGTSLPPGITPRAHGAGESFPEVETGDGVRNADNRRVEIFCFAGAINPPPPSDRKSRKGSKEYPAWRDQVTETIDFTGEDREANSGTIFMEIFSSDGVSPLTGKTYVIRSDDGSTVLKGTIEASGRLRHRNIPNDDYTLTIQGIEETCAALVLLHSAEEPQIRFLG